MSDAPKNVFELKEAARRKARVASDTQDQREKARESQRATWTHQQDAPRMSSGKAAGTDLPALKRAERAFTSAQKQPNAEIPSISTIIAVIEKWQREQAHYFESAFNYNSLVNYIVTGIANGWFTLSVEAVADGYARLLANNMVETAPDEYFDPKLNAIVRARGTVARSAPVMYPKYVWPAEEAAAREEEIAQVLADHQAGRKEAEARPFEELQKEVRQTFKSPKQGDPNLDRS